MATDVTITFSTPSDIEITLTGDVERVYLEWRDAGGPIDGWYKLMGAMAHEVEMKMDITDSITGVYE